MRSKPSFKMKLLPRVGGAEVAKPRYVRYPARDALPRPLKKQADIHSVVLSSFLDRIYKIYRILAWRTGDTEA